MILYSALLQPRYYIGRKENTSGNLCDFLQFRIEAGYTIFNEIIIILIALTITITINESSLKVTFESFQPLLQIRILVGRKMCTVCNACIFLRFRFFFSDVILITIK